jgi:hypothetical protein
MSYDKIYKLQRIKHNDVPSLSIESSSDMFQIFCYVTTFNYKYIDIF